LAGDPALDGYRKILYHRRGYAGSSAAEGRGSITRDAADCQRLLGEVGVDRAHVVGLSYAGAVGLQLTADAPECTHTLTLLEPPPVHTPSAPDFRAANDRLIATRHERGSAAALDEFLSLVIGSDWQEVAEKQLPGSSAQMRQDAATFLDSDLPALLGWDFGPDDAARIHCPILYVGGSDSGPWFAEVRQLMLTWFPKAEDVVIDGAGHSLALTHAGQIAPALATFLRRHQKNHLDRALR
jgi:pimeloyl-ACP methyl ester carboxylesterase